MNAVSTISVSQGVLTLSGDVNCWTVGGLVSESKKLDLNGVNAIDCTAISSFDSAAIAFFIVLIRALPCDKLSLLGDDGGLHNLATLYGVDEFFSTGD